MTPGDPVEVSEEKPTPVAATALERSQFILYYYLLFTNDCESYEDFKFAAGMLEEYMSLNIRELKKL